MPLDKPSRNTTGVPVFESKSCLYRYTYIYIYIYKTIIYDQRDCKEVLQLALSDSLMHKCELWVLNFREKRDVKNQSQIENSSFSLLSFFPTKKIPRYCFHPQSCISPPPGHRGNRLLFSAVGTKILLGQIYLIDIPFEAVIQTIPFLTAEWVMRKISIFMSAIFFLSSRASKDFGR